MNRCLICFNPKEEKLTEICICNKCLKRFKLINKKVFYRGVEIFILYKYDDFFKELLYRYKGCYDHSLKDAFFNDNLLFLKWKYRKRNIICAPSFKEHDDIRGFNHIKELAKVLGLDIIDCLTKTKKYKQSDQRYRERRNIQKYIKIDKSVLNDKDRVLILDDVTTSLSTIKAIIHLLPTNIDIKVLVLASNCRFMENEMN